MSAFQLVSLPAGRVLFHESDFGACAYIVESGTIEISVERNGRKVLIAKVGAGEFVGEMAILTDARRSATATAVDDCVLRKINAEQFTHRISEMEPVMRMAIETTLHRLSSTLELLRSPKDAHLVSERKPQGTLAALETLKLEGEIEAAVQQGELRVFYQPIVDLPSSRLYGFEGLVRWQHPEHGLLPPGYFIPTASKSSLIQHVTSFCLQQSCQDLPRLRAAGADNADNVAPINISINITGRDLETDDIVDRYRHELAANELEPGALTFEITETSLMNDPLQAAAVLSKLRTVGAGVAIDDFGTGYSSMAHLARLPATILKIDRSFVSAMTESEQNCKIVTIILSLARELDMRVVAEGIETPSDFEFLKQHDCDLGQGFLFAKPLPLDEAIALTESWDANRFISEASTVDAGALQVA